MKNNRLVILRNLFYTILMFVIMICFTSCRTIFGDIVKLSLSYILCHSIIGGIVLVIELIIIFIFADEYDSIVKLVWAGIICLFLFVIPYIYMPININKFYWLKCLSSSIVFIISTSIILYFEDDSYLEKKGGYSILFLLIALIEVSGVLFTVRPNFWLFSNISTTYTISMSLIFGRAIAERARYIEMYLYHNYEPACNKWIGLYGFVFSIISFVPLYLQFPLTIYFMIQGIGFLVGLLIWSIYWGTSNSAYKKATDILLAEYKIRKEQEQEEKRLEQERKEKEMQEHFRKIKEEEEFAKRKEEERIKKEQQQEELTRRKTDEERKLKQEHARIVSEQTGIILD